MDKQIKNQGTGLSKLDIQDDNDIKVISSAAKEVQSPEALEVASAAVAIPIVAANMSLDPAALERVAAVRLHDSAQARAVLGFNTVEPVISKQQQLIIEEEAKQSSWLKKTEDAMTAQLVTTVKTPSDNKVESDEIFTASQPDAKSVIPPDIESKYKRVGDKFYHPLNPNLVAFEDKGNKLETKSNSESIAESMVRIAEARGWDEIKVSGSEAFRKEVWLEAVSRGMHVKGYFPSEQDKADLAKRTSEADDKKVEKGNKPFRARENEKENSAENMGAAPVSVASDGQKQVAAAAPVRDDSAKVAGLDDKDARRKLLNAERANTFARESAVKAVKKYPELAGAVAMVVMIDKKAEADGLSERERVLIAARVRQNIFNRLERGELPQVFIKEQVEIKREANTEKEYSR